MSNSGRLISESGNARKFEINIITPALRIEMNLNKNRRSTPQEERHV